MSYTFSRRDFMKYTALTAVAVAGAGMFTGCGGNPNQPSGVFTGAADVPLSFGGSSGGFMGIGATHDKHILLKEGTGWDGTELTCAFSHRPISEGTSSGSKYYRIRVDTAKGAQYYVSGDTTGVTIKTAQEVSPIQIGKYGNLPQMNTVTVTGLDVTGATAVYIQYFPRHTALGNDKDSYADVFATWNITSLFNLNP